MNFVDLILQNKLEEAKELIFEHLDAIVSLRLEEAKPYVVEEMFEEVEVDEEVLEEAAKKRNPNIVKMGRIVKIRRRIRRNKKGRIIVQRNVKKSGLKGYRISGGLLYIHGKDQKDLQLTTDDKTAFQETMDEFVSEVSDLVDFGPLNLYKNSVEWSGKIVDFDVEFFMTIGEQNGVYINGNQLKLDEKFMDTISKLTGFYEKFKSKWAKVIAGRKKTSTKEK